MDALRTFGISALSFGLVMCGGCKPSAETPAKPGLVNDTRVASEGAAGNNWLLNGRTFDEAHFSPLTQISDKNVSTLGLAWYLDIEGAMGVVAEPLEVDGVIYVSAPQSKIYAVDAV